MRWPINLVSADILHPFRYSGGDYILDTTRPGYSNAPVSDPSEAGAPEVTEEMIEAGVDELTGRWDEVMYPSTQHRPYREVVRAIYLAMSQRVVRP
jgi:hypothetical protein